MTRNTETTGTTFEEGETFVKEVAYESYRAEMKYRDIFIAQENSINNVDFF